MTTSVRNLSTSQQEARERKICEICKNALIVGVLAVATQIFQLLLVYAFSGTLGAFFIQTGVFAMIFAIAMTFIGFYAIRANSSGLAWLFVVIGIVFEYVASRQVLPYLWSQIVGS